MGVRALRAGDPRPPCPGDAWPRSRRRCAAPPAHAQARQPGLPRAAAGHHATPSWTRRWPRWDARSTRRWRELHVARRSSKVFPSVDEALAGLLRDGMTIMSGGFGLCGNAEALHRGHRAQRGQEPDHHQQQLRQPGPGAGGAAEEPAGGARDLQLHRRQPRSGRAVHDAAQVKVELTPQGTLAERIRAGGAGIAGFYTPTGVGTVVAEGKEVREIDGSTYVLERPLRADLAIVRAAVGDIDGNLRFYRTARNFNPMMAMAADVTVAEVDKLVAAGRDRSRRRAPARHLRASASSRCASTATSSSTGPRARWSARRGRERDELVARRDGPARRRRGAGRPDREPGHRPADRGRQLHPARRQRDAALGERPARHGPLPDRGRGRPAADQRRQADGDRAARRQHRSIRRCRSR